MKANLAEVMESIQGEGLLVGTRQVFVRFNGCNLQCNYCDTKASREMADCCIIYQETGTRGQAITLNNPIEVEQLIKITKNYSAKWISLTGGEPLLHTDFIKEFAVAMVTDGYKLLLETNGTLYEELDMVLPYINMISMDIKLPSATGKDCFAMHRSFLQEAVVKPLYAKIVITSDVDLQELSEAVQIIADVNPDIPLMLQPVTPCNNVIPPGIAKLLEIQKQYQQQLNEVRILPQVHTLMNLI